MAAVRDFDCVPGCFNFRLFCKIRIFRRIKNFVYAA